MKFPIVFRILGVSNIIFSVLLLFIALILYTTIGQILLFEALTVAIYSSVAVWLIIAAFVWFFAFSGAYIFLYTSSLSVFVIAGHLVYCIFGSKSLESFGSLRQSEKTLLLIFVLLISLYAIFIFLSMFFKPVIQWSAQTADPKKEKFNPLLLSLFFLLLITGPSIILIINRQKNEVLIFPLKVFTMQSDYQNGFLLIDQDLATGWSLYTKAKEQPSITFSFNEEKDLAKIKILCEDAWLSKAEIEYDSNKKTTITFLPSGDTAIANVAGIKTKTIKLIPVSFLAFNSKAEKFTSVIKEIYFSAFYPHFKRRDYFNTDLINYSVNNENEESEELSDPEENSRRVRLENFYYPGIDEMAKWESLFKNEPTVVTIKDHDFGMYMGGSSGLRYYFFSACFENGSDLEEEEAIYKYTGIKPFTKKAKDKTEFNYVNPKFVKWISENLIPDDDEILYGYEISALYDVVGQRYCRLLTETHESISYGNLDQVRSEYLDSMATPDFEAVSYLNTKYGTFFPDYATTRDGQLKPETAIGFWIRRHIDGSEDELWKALTKIMRRYDEEWFIQKTSH